MTEQTKECRHCGNKNPEKGFADFRLIYRDRHPVTRKAVILSKNITVCAGTNCGGNHQMAHEG